MFKKVAINYFVLWTLQVIYESSLFNHQHPIEKSSFGLSFFQGFGQLRVSLFAKADRSVFSEQPLVHERSHLWVEPGFLLAFFFWENWTLWTPSNYANACQCIVCLPPATNALGPISKSWRSIKMILTCKRRSSGVASRWSWHANEDQVA